ncbi:hypothetical protein MP228_012771 [Amoeboaphelidium protococcarum]|nr:hypothetical protein MP228_012771 [Amoeboaphelidium protococcarum]
MTSPLLLQLLELQDSFLYEYLRPVDLLELTLTSRLVQDTLLRQKFQVRDTYFAYYGPILAMYRVKMHPYLQLKTAEDYKFFLHHDLGYDRSLYFLALGLCKPIGERRVAEWDKAILGSISADDQKEEQVSHQFNEWQQHLLLVQEYVYLSTMEHLAVSSIDFLITLFRLFATEVGSKSMQRYIGSHPLVWRYGYVHDAIKKCGLQALVFVINYYFDEIAFKVSEDVEITGPIFIRQICQYFQLGDCSQILQQLDQLMEVEPNFQNLIAYYGVAKEQGLYETLNVEAHLKASLVKIMAHSNSQQSQPKRRNCNMERHHSLWQISVPLHDILYWNVPFDWVKQLVLHQDSLVVNSIECGWFIVELLMTYSSSKSSSIVMQFMLDKIYNGHAQQAHYLLIAVTSCSQDYNFGSFEHAMLDVKKDFKNEFKDVLFQVFDFLLGNPEAICHALHLRLFMAFEVFQDILAEQQQDLLSKTIVAFSQAHDITQDANECPHHSHLIRIIKALGGEQAFASFILIMDAETLSQCNGCILASIIYIFKWKYKGPLTDELCTRLVSLYADVDNPKLTAEFLSEMYIILDFSDAVICELKRTHTAEQLKAVCSHLSPGCIDELQLGVEYQSEWIQEIEVVSTGLPYPENIIRIVEIANENCGCFGNAPWPYRTEQKQVLEGCITWSKSGKMIQGGPMIPDDVELVNGYDVSHYTFWSN